MLMLSCTHNHICMRMHTCISYAYASPKMQSHGPKVSKQKIFYTQVSVKVKGRLTHNSSDIPPGELNLSAFVESL